MRAHKLAALLFACAVVSLPLRALASGDGPGDHVDNVSSAAVPEPARPDADDAPSARTSPSADPSAEPDDLDFSLRKALLAPLRGVAKLFGEDDKGSRATDDKGSQAAKDAAAQPRGDGAAAATNAAPRVAPAGEAAGYEPAPGLTDGPFMPLVVGVPNDPISQGRALIQRGLYEQAITELSVAAATGVNLVEANNLLGLAYDHRGEHAHAREYYERALTLAPRDPHVLNNLGYSLYLDDRPKEALAKLKAALAIDPSSGEIYNNLGFAFAKLNKFDDAFNCFTQAGGDLYARVRTATLLEQAGRDRAAIKHYEAARKLDPSSTDILRRLIDLYNRTGQRDKAETVERSLDETKSKASGSTTD